MQLFLVYQIMLILMKFLEHFISFLFHLSWSRSLTFKPAPSKNSRLRPGPHHCISFTCSRLTRCWLQLQLQLRIHTTFKFPAISPRTEKLTERMIGSTELEPETPVFFICLRRPHNTVASNVTDSTTYGSALKER